MKTLSQHVFGFTRWQRLGLLSLFAAMISIQSLYYLLDPIPSETVEFGRDEWLALQPRIDSLKSAGEIQRNKIYPFNPNFITDYKGYRLGMSVAEIDRLLAFRKRGKWVNSAADFQNVTKVSDSLLAEISPLFKFPDWVTNPKKRKYDYGGYAKNDRPIKKIDINKATKDELMAVYGIGPALSDRILKQRELLGSFLSMDQMPMIWGLSDEVVEKLRERFVVLGNPEVKKIKVNSADLKEMAAFPYFRYALAKNVLTYRSMNGEIRNSEELAKIKDFPVENLKIIALYLEL